MNLRKLCDKFSPFSCVFVIPREKIIFFRFLNQSMIHKHFVGVTEERVRRAKVLCKLCTLTTLEKKKIDLDDHMEKPI